jgi:hypothetical protein
MTKAKEFDIIAGKITTLLYDSLIAINKIQFDVRFDENSLNVTTSKLKDIDFGLVSAITSVNVSVDLVKNKKHKTRFDEALDSIANNVLTILSPIKVHIQHLYEDLCVCSTDPEGTDALLDTFIKSLNTSFSAINALLANYISTDLFDMLDCIAELTEANYINNSEDSDELGEEMFN